MAKSRSDRYEQELIAEMDRNTALARQSARLREENTALKEELRTANAKADALERLTRDLQAADGLRSTADAAQGAGQGDPGPEQAAADASARDEKLHQAQTALLHTQRDLELANTALADAHAQAKLLSQRLETAERRLEEAREKENDAPAQKEESAGDLQAQVKSLEVALKHHRAELETTKSEAREVPELRRKAAQLNMTLAREEELAQRVERVENKLADALENEASLRRERDALQHWKVGLEVGLPELAGPTQVVQAYRGLQQKVVVLQAEIVAQRSRIEAMTSKIAGLEAAETASVVARRELEERVLQLEKDLTLSQAEVAREGRKTLLEQEMVKSLKAEEVLLRDKTVLALQQETTALQTQMMNNQTSHELALKAAKDEISKVRVELGKVREAAQAVKRDLTGTKTELAAAQSSAVKADEELARTKEDLNKAKEDSNKVRRELNGVRGELKAAQEAASKEKEQAVKDKATVQSLVDAEREKFKKLGVQTNLKIAELKTRQSFERLLPHIFGYDVKFQAGKAVEGKDTPVLVVLSDSALTATGNPPAEKETVSCVNISGPAQNGH